MKTAGFKRQASGFKQLALSLAACLLALSACGFQLRGSYTASPWPAELATLRVLVHGSESAQDPLRQAVVLALERRAGVKVRSGLPPAGEKGVPVVQIDREVVRSQPLTVSPASVKVAQVLLTYATGVTLLDAEGRTLLTPQLIRLRRDYQYDASAVVAKRFEQDELVQVMRAEAVELILERVASYRRKDADQRG